MLNLTIQSGSALREGLQRFEAGVSRLTDAIRSASAAGPGSVAPPQPTLARNGTDLDLARALAEEILARQEIEANLKLVHARDETLGRVIDTFA